MDWFRYYTTTLENRKVQALPPVLFKAWINMLCIARIFDGVLPPNEEIEFRLRCSSSQCASWIKDLKERRLLDETPQGELIPHDWKEHQYQSDTSTQRSRNSRNKKQQRPMQQPCNVAATLLQRPQSRAEQITEQTTEAEQLPALVSASEYPLTTQEIHRHDPACDDMFVLRMVQGVFQACLSDEKCPQSEVAQIDDEVIARAVKESFAKFNGRNGHGTGLLLTRVPQIIKTWCKED